MIIIKSFKVLFDKKGNPHAVMPKIVKKIANNHTFDFDIYKPIEWKKFLSSYRGESGKLLPRFSSAGDPVVYTVYTWGTPKWMKEGLSEKIRLTQGSSLKVVHFFPGYDEAGNTRSIEIYGSIK